MGRIRYTYLIMPMVLVVANAASATTKPNKVLGLEEMIQYALEHSPKFDSAKRSLEIRDIKLKNKLFAFLPSLDSSGSMGTSGKLGEDGISDWVGSISMSLKQPIVSGSTNWIAYGIEKLKQEKAEVSLKNSRERLLLSILRRYYDYSLELRRLQTQQKKHDLLKEQYREVAKQYALKKRSKIDFLRFQAQMQSAEIAVLDIKNDIEQIRQDLKRLIGVPFDELNGGSIRFKPDQAKSMSLSDVPGQKPNLQKHLGFRALKLKGRINVLSHKLAKFDYWPNLGLSASMTYGNKFGGSELAEHKSAITWSVGLSSGYDLFDWGRNFRDVAISKKGSQITENDIFVDMVDLNNNIENLMMDMEILKENYELSRGLLKLEQENFALLEKDYREGRARYLDLIVGLNGLSSSMNRQYSSMYRLKKAIARYRFYEGTLYESMFGKKGPKAL